MPGPRAWGHHKPHHRHARRRALAALLEARAGGPGPWGEGPKGGPFGRGGFGGFGPGPRGRGRGRARRGDVRLALLRLLGEEPANGYQLMQTIEQRSEGNWRPSPGSVYPTLAQLEDEGLVRSVEAEGQRRFELTDAGREHLATRSEEPAPWDIPEEHGPSGRDAKRLIGAVAQAAMQVAIAGDDTQKAQAMELLAETQRGLYRILASDPEE
ncbi:MAG TPA: PadR family transcriptional regulator [Solirubrobacteraceae bacterium]